MATGEAGREDELVYVSGSDVIPGVCRTPPEIVGATIGGSRWRVLSRMHPIGQSTAQCPYHLAPERAPLLFRAGMYQGNPASQMVEDQQRAGRYIVEGRHAAFEPAAPWESLKEAAPHRMTNSRRVHRPAAPRQYPAPAVGPAARRRAARPTTRRCWLEWACARCPR